MKNLHINYCFILLFSFLLLHTQQQIQAQDTLAMTFDERKKVEGFSFKNFKYEDKTQAIYPLEANVNMDPSVITKDEGCFNLISFERRKGGGGTWRVWDNTGREKFFKARGGTLTLNWEKIQWIKFKLDDPGSGNPNNTWDLDSIVYTIPVVISASKPSLSLNKSEICEGKSATLTISGEFNDASEWEVYEGSCEGELLGTTSGNSFKVSPTTTTTYYVRGVGVCPPPGECSDPITLTVKKHSTPFTSVSPSAPSICPGEEIFLEPAGGIAGAGAEAKWYTGPNGTGANIPTIDQAGRIKVAPIQNTVYYVRREGDCNTTTDFAYIVVVANAILEHPSDVFGCIDGAASFKATISGDVIRTYQWSYSSDNGNTWNTLNEGGAAPSVTGAKLPILYLINIPASWDGYLFRLTASADCAIVENVTSNSAQLSLGISPTLIESPDHSTTCAKGKVSFTASFEDATSLQWQQSNDNGSTWADMSNSERVSGVNTVTLSIQNIPGYFSGRRYRLKATNCMNVFSDVAILTVENSPTPSAHPSGQKIIDGQTAAFAAGFNGALFIKWVYTSDNGKTWTPLQDGGTNPTIAGSGTNSLVLINVPLSWNGRRFALRGINSICPPTYTDPALLSFIECDPPTVEEHPSRATTCRDGNASFSATLTGDNPINFQWSYSTDNGNSWSDLENGGTAPKVSGAKTSTLDLSNIPASWDGFLFRMNGSSDCELPKKVRSDNAKLKVWADPEISVPSSPIFSCNGEPVVFTSQLNSNVGNDISYRWQESSDDGNTWQDVNDGGDISGSFTKELSFSNVPASFSGKQYRLAVFSCEETFYSASILLLVNTTTVHPTDKSVVKNGNTGFSAEFQYAEEVNWEYTTDGGNTWNTLTDGGSEPLIEGVTTNTLKLNNVPLSWDGREFALKGKNPACDPTYTNLALLEVEDCDPPTVDEQPSDVTICAEESTYIQSYFSGATSFRWQGSDDNGATWTDISDGDYKGIDILGAPTEAILLGFVPASASGMQFRLKATNCSETVYSSVATLTVIKIPVANLHPTNVTVGKDANIQFTAGFDDADELNWVYTADHGVTWTTLTDGGSKPQISGATTNTLNLDGIPTSWSGRQFALIAKNSLCPSTVYTKPALLKVTNSAPVAKCQDITVYMEDCVASIVASQIDNGSYDPDGDELTSITINKNVFNIEKSFTVKLTVSDGELSDECIATVLVKDKIPPVAMCKDVTLNLNKNGEVIINPMKIDNGSYDNCQGIKVKFTTSEFKLNCSKIGPNTITLTVQDQSENKNSCESIVYVEDNMAPVPDQSTLPSIELDCSSSLVPPTATDNCAGAIIATTDDLSTFSTIGTHIITWIYDDGNGNIETQTQTVIIKDNSKPVPDVSNLPTVTLTCSESVSPPTATDNCEGLITATTTDPTSFSVQGNYTITWIYDDGNGNIETQTQTVMVVDNSKPVPVVSTLPTITGECSVTIANPPTATDNCDGNLIQGTTSDPLYYDQQGQYTITWTYDDGNGNIETQTQTVIVEDLTKPVPDEVNLPNVTGECSATVSAIPTATDACEGTIVGTTSDPLFYDQQGQYTITWTYDDGNGNIETQTQTVIVEDLTKPVPDLNSLPDLTAECAVSLSSAPTATDNCTGTIIGTTTDPLSYSSQGTHTIIWTFDDGNGNAVTQTQTVIIKDVTAPVPDVATLPTITASCEAGLEPPFATDNCVGQVVGTTSDPLYFDKEGTYTVTWIFDDGNGNSSSQDQTIVIMNDATPVPDRNNLPTLRAQCGLTVSQVPTASDHCGGTIVATTSDPLTYNTQGTHLITWTFDNGNGNTATQTQQIIIRDTKAPVPDRANLPALGGSCSLLITNFPTATDNCAGSVTATTDSPLEFDQEGTYAIIWNYEDGNGNTSSQTQWVIISSDAEPTAECKNISVALGTSNQVNIKAVDIDKGSYDECGTVTLLISSAGSSVIGTALPPAPSMDLYCKDGKVQNLMLSVTNEKGNTAYCQATVFLEGADSDNDGILDQCDNCSDTYNPDQEDSNNNGTGDACEESTDPGTDPGSWEGWSLKKQGSDQTKLITELRAFPNPFQEEVNLSFNLNQEERTTVEIFNIQGQRVHTLLSEIAPRGEHRVQWDGKDQNGQPMPAGIYLIRLRAGKALINQKVVLQR